MYGCLRKGTRKEEGHISGDFVCADRPPQSQQDRNTPFSASFSSTQRETRVLRALPETPGFSWFDSSMTAGCILELLVWTCVLQCFLIGRWALLRDGRRVILSSQVSRGVHPRCCHWRSEPSPWAGRHVSMPFKREGNSTWPQLASMHTISAYILCAEAAWAT